MGICNKSYSFCYVLKKIEELRIQLDVSWALTL